MCNLTLVMDLVTGESAGANLKEHESEVKVAQSCPTLGNPMDYTVHGILQARILEWVAFPFSRGSSQPRDRTQVSCILYQLSHKVILLWAPASGTIITGFSSKLRLANSNQKSVSSPHCKGCLENQESQLHLNPNRGTHSKFQAPTSPQSMP